MHLIKMSFKIHHLDYKFAQIDKALSVNFAIHLKIEVITFEITWLQKA
jgi:hypothetical protein